MWKEIHIFTCHKTSCFQKLDPEGAISFCISDYTWAEIIIALLEMLYFCTSCLKLEYRETGIKKATLESSGFLF